MVIAPLFFIGVVEDGAEPSFDSVLKILKEKKFLENIFSDFNSTVNELENLEQLLELASKENDVAVIKDCEKVFK